VTKIHNRLPWLLACWAVAQGAAPRVDEGRVAAALFGIFWRPRRLAAVAGQRERRSGVPLPGRRLRHARSGAAGAPGTRVACPFPALARPLRAHAFIKRKRIRGGEYVLALVDVRTGTLLRRTTTATSVHDVAVDMRTLQLKVADTITLQDTAVAADCGGDWIAIASGDGTRRDVRVLSASSRACVQWLPNLDWVQDHGFDVCLLPAQHELAVTLRDHVAVFRPADGACVRRLGAQLLRQPERLARSCEGELVVVDIRMKRAADKGCWFRETRRVGVFQASGDVGAVGDNVRYRHEDAAVLHDGVVDVGVRGEFHVWR
jgi:hypothetical protein